MRCCGGLRRICRRRTSTSVTRQNDLPARQGAGHDGIPVTVACRVLKLATQPYCWWKQRPVGDPSWVRMHPVSALVDAYRGDPELRHRCRPNGARTAGWRMSRRTAWRLYSEAGITPALALGDAASPEKQKQEAGASGIRRLRATRVHRRRTEPALAHRHQRALDDCWTPSLRSQALGQRYEGRLREPDG